MNICICVNTLSYAMGGVSTHILDLCKQFSAHATIEKIVVCCDGGEHIPALSVIPKVIYYRLPFEKYGLSFQGVCKGYRELRRIVSSEQISIIHVHSQRILPSAHLIKIRLGVPYLWTNHIDAIPNQRVFRCMCALMRFPVISVSQELRNMMICKYHCNPQKVFAVNNGIDLDEFDPLRDDEITRLEHEYAIDRSKTPYIISLLSRVTYVKGHKILLQAIARCRYREQIHIIFAGHTYPESEAYRNEVQLLAKHEGIRTTFLDWSKPREVFGVSDLFVLPSLYEGFALVCIEALAMGCAVLRSRTPGWQEMQDFVGIFEKGDVDGLSEMIENAIKHDFFPDKTAIGYKRVREEFTKEHCANETLAVYERILNS